MKLQHILPCMLSACILFSCTKDEPTLDVTKNGQLKIKFDQIVGGKKLILNETTYTNNSEEQFIVSTAKYYVSNIVLTNNNGQSYTVPKSESFFLINAANSESLTPSVLVPEGQYTTLQFNLGIDSITNTLPVSERTGVLDVAGNDMYWSWNSGYIFFKLEGSSTSSTTADQKFRYHIGLFGGYDTKTVNNNKTVVLDLSKAGTAIVQENLSSDIHLMVDLGKVFDGKNKISIATNSTVMTSGPHQLIAENYAQMFTHDHTHNYQKISNE
ncbi:hypothetical protein FAZ15_02380 [Sphingobacterium olei]|uniref:Copper-binding protein MbnP-like domain-containing protein n=1 Tax=Sphingobacterium olei TaxID=2571155 RepID=A0A4U0P6U9_9SPHI|nr:MbnP family protein [Sphingobacterium olei]TJZ63163.1 hypothetical protein FAZ15_02380 [Sphingobacterium olei]